MRVMADQRDYSKHLTFITGVGENQKAMLERSGLP